MDLKISVSILSAISSSLWILRDSFSDNMSQKIIPAATILLKPRYYHSNSWSIFLGDFIHAYIYRRNPSNKTNQKYKVTYGSNNNKKY